MEKVVLHQNKKEGSIGTITLQSTPWNHVGQYAKDHITKDQTTQSARVGETVPRQRGKPTQVLQQVEQPGNLDTEKKILSPRNTETNSPT